MVLGKIDMGITTNPLLTDLKRMDQQKELFEESKEGSSISSCAIWPLRRMVQGGNELLLLLEKCSTFIGRDQPRMSSD